jgi:hypothetical protein
MDGITVLSADARGTVSVEFGANGDRNGDDIQFIPEEVLNSPAFKRNLARGVIRVIEDESDPEVVSALAKQVEAFQRRQRGAQEEIQATIDKAEDNDVVALFCVGPDNRGTGKCGEAVLVKSTAKDNAPPLCGQHKHLAPQYIPEHIVPGPGEPGERRIEWTRVTLGVRERTPSK